MYLKWQLVNTLSFVMLACVEVFKTSVLQQSPALHCTPHSPIERERETTFSKEKNQLHMDWSETVYMSGVKCSIITQF